MSFLILKDNKVRCTEEGFSLKEVKRVWNNDKSGKEKSYFNNVITGIFYIYKPRGLFWHKALAERIEKVNKDYLVNSHWSDIIKRDGVEDLVKLYIELSWTINEIMMEKVKSRAVEFINYLYEIPLSVKRVVKRGEEIYDAETEKNIRVTIEKEIIFPNIEANKEAYEMAVIISKNIKAIEELLRVEESEREKDEAIGRKYDSRERNQFVQPDQEKI